MATFIEAMTAMQAGKQVRSPAIRTPMHIGVYFGGKTRIVLGLEAGGVVEWVPHQYEILSDKWEIVE